MHYKTGGSTHLTRIVATKNSFSFTISTHSFTTT